LPLVPKLENRTLRISPDIAGFEYQYEICIKKGWFGIGCAKTEMKKEYFDLTKPEIRKQLIDMGFKARIPEKP
jgi:hypothetical protein